MTQAASLPMGVPQFRPIPKIVTPKPEYAEIASNPTSISFNNQALEPSGFKPLSIERSGIEAVVRQTIFFFFIQCIKLKLSVCLMLHDLNVREYLERVFI